MVGLTFYCIRKKLNPPPGLVKKINSLQILLNYKRDAFNNKMEVTDENKKDLQELIDGEKGHKELQIYKIMIAIQNSHTKTDPLAELKEQEGKLDGKIKRINRRIMYKWIITFIAFVLTVIFSQSVVVYYLNFLMANKSKTLYEKVSGMLGDTHVVTDNTLIANTGFLFPAWSTERRLPLFYSPKFIPEYTPVNMQWKDLDLAKMATGSATNGVYFNEFGLQDQLAFFNKTSGKDEKDLVTGAAAIATSPALYAYFTASESFYIPADKMSVTVVGSIKGRTDKITSKVNLLQWVSRLVSLSSPVKEDTQQYMVEHILRQYGKSWAEFHLSSDPFAQSWQQKYFGSTNFENTKSNAEDMITENHVELERHIL